MIGMKRPPPSVSSRTIRTGATLARFEDELLAVLPRLRRFARSLSRHAADADDLCQIAVEKALNARDQWQPGTRMDSWMYRITRNAWIDQGRARARAAQTFLPEEAGVAIGDDGVRAIEALGARCGSPRHGDAARRTARGGRARTDRGTCLQGRRGGAGRADGYADLTSGARPAGAACQDGRSRVTIDDAMLIAYVDGELGPIEAKRVDAR